MTTTEPGGQGRFITTQSVVLAVSLHLDELPPPGSSALASSSSSGPGGGYTTLAVAAKQGVAASLAAPLGTGPNSYAVRKILRTAGIEVLTEALVGDIGTSMVFIDEGGFITTVRTEGVETEPTLAGLEAIGLLPGDLVLIHGADLASHAAGVLAEWGSRLPSHVTLVLAVSPAVEQISAETWLKLLPRADVLTMNVREASALARKLEAASPGTRCHDLLPSNAGIVRRLGVMGCEVQTAPNAPAVSLPSYRAERADTTGVGDTHVATMCASLLQGLDLVQACQRANAAAAVMVGRRYSVRVPSSADIDRVLAAGSVS